MFGGLGIFSGQVKSITPTASTRLSHPGIAAKYGGPIDVLERRVKESNTADEQVRMEYFNPRFSMKIAPPPEIVNRLWAGIAALFPDWLRKKDRAAAAR